MGRRATYESITNKLSREFENKKFKLNKIELRSSKKFSYVSFVYYCGEYIGHIDLENRAPFIMATDNRKMDRISFLIENSINYKDSLGCSNPKYSGIVSLIKGKTNKRRIAFYELDLDNFLLIRKVFMEKYNKQQILGVAE
jgi:hypothetical protein